MKRRTSDNYFRKFGAVEPKKSVPRTAIKINNNNTYLSTNKWKKRSGLYLATIRARSKQNTF